MAELVEESDQAITKMPAINKKRAIVIRVASSRTEFYTNDES
jgi:hypothetical protein